jgi:hypothetical protein
MGVCLIKTKPSILPLRWNPIVRQPEPRFKFMGAL